MNRQSNLIICVLWLLQLADTFGSKCLDAAESNNIPYIRMCEDGIVTSHRVILDTHEAEATGGTTCSCFADSGEIVNIYIAHFGNGLNPKTSDCGSEVSVIGVTGIDREYKCNTIPIIYFAIRPVTMTWNMTSDGDSKYCLNITGIVTNPNTTLTITCSKPEVITSPTSSSSSTTITTTETTTKYVSHTTDVIRDGKTTDVNIKSTPLIPTTTDADTIVCSRSYDEEGYVYLPVYAFVIVIVFLCLTIIYAAIVTFLYFRRCVTSNRQPYIHKNTETASELKTDEKSENISVLPITDRAYEPLELSQVGVTSNVYDDLHSTTLTH